MELPACGPFDDSVDWTVKVSEHNGFPRRVWPTDEAFERAIWQFEGPLSAAVAELVATPS